MMNSTQGLNVNDATKLGGYSMPKIPDAPAVKPVPAGTAGAHSAAGKVIGLGAVGIVAGVAGAVGVTKAVAKPVNTSIDPEFNDDVEVATPVEEAVDGRTDENDGAHSPLADAIRHAVDADLGNVMAHASGHASGHTDAPVHSDFNSAPIAWNVDDMMTFNAAFGAAREEVGAGGVFFWRGGVFGTYYANEWAALPAEYRAEFSSNNWYDHPGVELVAGHPVPAEEVSPFEFITTPDGEIMAVYVSAETGEKVVLPIDGSMTPVLDDHGQLLAVVSDDVVLNINAGSSDAVYITDGNEVMMVDDPVAAHLGEERDYAMVVDLKDESVEMAETFSPSDDDLVAVLGADGEPVNVEEATLFDGDVAVIAMDDEDVVALTDDPALFYGGNEGSSDPDGFNGDNPEPEMDSDMMGDDALFDDYTI